jgi:hypothetical protein
MSIDHSEEHQNGTTTAIPIRYFRNETELPNNVSYSVGGTIYGTTPGGSKIIYSRDALLKCKDSPLSKTPPKLLGDIPEEILRNKDAFKKTDEEAGKRVEPLKSLGQNAERKRDEDEPFDME